MLMPKSELIWCEGWTTGFKGNNWTKFYADQAVGRESIIDPNTTEEVKGHLYHLKLIGPDEYNYIVGRISSTTIPSFYWIDKLSMWGWWKRLPFGIEFIWRVKWHITGSSQNVVGIRIAKNGDYTYTGSISIVIAYYDTSSITFRVSVYGTAVIDVGVGIPPSIDDYALIKIIFVPYVFGLNDGMILAFIKGPNWEVLQSCGSYYGSNIDFSKPHNIAIFNRVGTTGDVSEQWTDYIIIRPIYLEELRNYILRRDDYRI